MPGAHFQVYVHRTWADVGGCDVWLGSWSDDHLRWWIGYHSPKPQSEWWRTRPAEWRDIGVEVWDQRPNGYIVEAYYVHPMHSMSPPTGVWKYEQGLEWEWSYTHGGLLPPGPYNFLKGKGKAAGGPKGRGKAAGDPKGKGKAVGDPKGKGKGQGKDKGKGQGK